MGHKVHPNGFRRGVSRTWNAKWYADRDYTDLLERRATGGEVILEHPLAEGLAGDGDRIVQAEAFGQRAFAGAGGGGDPVDHAIGEGDVGDVGP